MIKKTRGGTLLSQVHQVCGRVWNRLLRNHDMSDLEGEEELYLHYGKMIVSRLKPCVKRLVLINQHLPESSVVF